MDEERVAAAESHHQSWDLDLHAGEVATVQMYGMIGDKSDVTQRASFGLTFADGAKQIGGVRVYGGLGDTQGRNSNPDNLALRGC